jgi:hypothetical protein
MAAASGSADQDDAASLLRPAWEDSDDETDADRGVRPLLSPARSLGRTGETDDLINLMSPLCGAIDALARLDARAGAADGPIREGLLARMAYTEAAGFLAHAHAWAHPLDLALRDLGLTASTALAAAGAPHRTLPQTFATTTDTAVWANPPLDVLPAGDAAIAEAMTLARTLRRLPRRPVATTAMVGTLLALGAGGLDPAEFAAWWGAAAPAPANHWRRWRGRRGKGTPPAPPLLVAGYAAQSWMEAGLTATPAPGQALSLAAASLARAGALQTFFLPVWSAYPALGFGDRDTLPRLRSDAADRLVGWSVPITWPLTFLHLIAESARMGLRQLDRLEAAAAKGRALTAGLDRRSRLPDAIDALLRTPVLTPNALAAKLKVAPQTATSVLRELLGKGVVREVTGRERFRAFAI